MLALLCKGIIKVPKGMSSNPGVMVGVGPGGTIPNSCHVCVSTLLAEVCIFVSPMLLHVHMICPCYHIQRI